MFKSKLFMAVALMAGLVFTGFQCSSTEITSAKLYRQQKNYDKAIEVLQKEVTKNPKSDEGYFLLGEIYGEKENYTEMANAFKKSMDISNKYSSDIKKITLKYWGDAFNKGANLFNKARQVSKDSSTYYFELSLKSFQSAANILPDSGNSYMNMAVILFNLGRTEEAVPVLKKLLDYEKTDQAYKTLGKTLFELGSITSDKYKKDKVTADSLKAMEYFNESIRVLEEARTKYPADSEILVFLFNNYNAINKQSVAKTTIIDALKADPNNKQLHFNYGVYLMQDNQFESAVDQFSKAVEIDQTYQNALYNLGITYLKWGKFLATEADKKKTEDKMAMENYKKAVDVLEKLIQLDERNPSFWRVLAQAYFYAGMNDKGKDALEKEKSLQ